ncbi:unnamed protein product, partial [Arabidopsis halleri]
FSSTFVHLSHQFFLSSSKFETKHRIIISSRLCAGSIS